MSCAQEISFFCYIMYSLGCSVRYQKINFQNLLYLQILLCYIKVTMWLRNYHFVPNPPAVFTFRKERKSLQTCCTCYHINSKIFASDKNLLNRLTKFLYEAHINPLKIPQNSIENLQQRQNYYYIFWQKNRI